MTGNPGGVQTSEALLSRKELGWGQLRCRSWPWADSSLLRGNKGLATQRPGRAGSFLGSQSSLLHAFTSVDRPLPSSHSI